MTALAALAADAYNLATAPLRALGRAAGRCAEWADAWLCDYGDER